MKKTSEQHSFAEKVSAILALAKIPEHSRDHLGNPMVAAQYIARLPRTVKSSLMINGQHRIILRSHPQ